MNYYCLAKWNEEVFPLKFEVTLWLWTNNVIGSFCTPWFGHFHCNWYKAVRNRNANEKTFHLSLWMFHSPVPLYYEDLSMKVTYRLVIILHSLDSWPKNDMAKVQHKQLWNPVCVIQIFIWIAHCNKSWHTVYNFCHCLFCPKEAYPVSLREIPNP